MELEHVSEAPAGPFKAEHSLMRRGVERTKDCSMHLTIDVLPRAAAMCSGVEFGFQRAGTVKSARSTP